MKLSSELQAEMHKLLQGYSNHRGCEDGWYACPASPDYIQHAEESGKCNCGAGEVRSLLARIQEYVLITAVRGS